MKSTNLTEAEKALGAAPKDKCGKYNHVHSEKSPHIEKAVKEHIASFKGNPSHYSRGASKKLYLPPELNVNKMHQMYKDKNLIHVTNACDKFQAEIHILEERIKSALSEEEKNNLKRREETEKKELQKPGVQHKHITRYCYGFPKKLQYAQHYQKLCPLQMTALSLFSFNIHVLSNSDSFFYCYNETIGGKGTDGVVSMLHHFIFTQLIQEVKHLEIFCDNCGVQNKNYTVVRYLHYVIHNTRRLDSLKEKPSPFYVIEVDQALLRAWTNCLSACPFAIRPVKEVLFQHYLGRLLYRSHPQELQKTGNFIF
ncbi:hypothetical protein PR048_012469 [Dryococelus australis]|uniref:Uncharacterized protein n=1 Tax=Dryococelus australis TaxID=614101 RepID=A0ABQ9HPH0_9NEOP|nr:hypothetical protein PR048_012469 [Dryococelus australis]